MNGDNASTVYAAVLFLAYCFHREISGLFWSIISKFQTASAKRKATAHSQPSTATTSSVATPEQSSSLRSSFKPSHRRSASASSAAQQLMLWGSVNTTRRRSSSVRFAEVTPDSATNSSEGSRSSNARKQHQRQQPTRLEILQQQERQSRREVERDFSEYSNDSPIPVSPLIMKQRSLRKSSSSKRSLSVKSHSEPHITIKESRSPPSSPRSQQPEQQQLRLPSNMSAVSLSVKRKMERQRSCGSSVTSPRWMAPVATNSTER